MTTLLGTVPDGRVGLTCSLCGCFFTLAFRSNSDRKKQGRDPICRMCQKPAVIICTDDLQEWWIDRFDEDTILEIAEACWGPVKTWGPREEWSLVPGVKESSGLREIEI